MKKIIVPAKPRPWKWQIKFSRGHKALVYRNKLLAMESPGCRMYVNKGWDSTPHTSRMTAKFLYLSPDKIRDYIAKRVIKRLSKTQFPANIDPIIEYPTENYTEIMTLDYFVAFSYGKPIVYQHYRRNKTYLAHNWDQISITTTRHTGRALDLRARDIRELLKTKPETYELCFLA